MSRLIVKNLPSYITPTLLKEHFSQSRGPHGTITDVKVILKQDGSARRFGFVGFKTDEEALKAKEWYDKTFIDSTRVRVEVIDVGALPSFPLLSEQNRVQYAKDAVTPRPKKRPRLDTSKRKDASLEEFMEVMQPKTNSWVDDVDPLLSSPEKNNVPAAQRRLKDISEEAQQDLTDLEWMRQRMTGGVGDAHSQENVFEQSGSEEEDQRASEEKDPTEETILRTARLFVRNLTFTCTEEELRGLFQPFGTVSQVRGIYLSK